MVLKAIVVTPLEVISVVVQIYPRSTTASGTHQPDVYVGISASIVPECACLDAEIHGGCGDREKDVRLFFTAGDQRVNVNVE